MENAAKLLVTGAVVLAVIGLALFGLARFGVTDLPGHSCGSPRAAT